MVTTDDLQNFSNFALPLISSGKAESMGQLLDQWEAQREHDETVEVLKQSYADMQAGRGVPAVKVFAEIRAKLGIKS